MPPSRARANVAASGGASSSKDVSHQRGTSVPTGAAAAAAPASTNPVFTNAKAETLYDLLLESQPPASTQTYTQADLLALSVASSVHELMPLCQELINLGLFQLLTLDGSVCYRLKTHSDASKVQSLDSDARIIYSTIEAAGTAGVWTKTLKARTNLHQTVLTRALKMLENRSYVKQVRNAKYPGRKIYMLQNLTPTDEVTGGPWYTDGELDQDLVHIVSDVILTYVESKSWRSGPKIKRPSGSSTGARHAHSTHHMISVHDRILLPHPPGYTGYPTAPEILTFIDSNNLVSGKDIELADLQTLLDILVFDRKLEVVAANTPSQKSATHRITKPGAAPQKQHPAKPANKPRSRARVRRIEDDDEDDDADAAPPPPAKRRKIFGLRGTPSPAPSDDPDDSDLDPEALPDEHNQDPMYRTVRHTGYPRPLSYNNQQQQQQHDHPAAAPQPTTTTTAPPDTDTAAAASAAPTQPTSLPPATTPAPPLSIATAEPPRTAFAETPCARCPVFRLCEDGGPVDARSCGYFGGWLAASAGDGVAAAAGFAGGGISGGIGGGAVEVDFTTTAAPARHGRGAGDGPGVVVEVDGERQAVAGAAVGVA